jgi:hypothetical protein
MQRLVAIQRLPRLRRTVGGRRHIPAGAARPRWADHTRRQVVILSEAGTAPGTDHMARKRHHRSLSWA